MVFIDFESSAAIGGHPIEVGICRVNVDRLIGSLMLNEIDALPSKLDWRPAKSKIPERLK